MQRRRPPFKVLLNQARVWELLDRLQMSQNRLAELCGISSGHMSHLMQGKRSPSARVRRRLQEALGVTEFDDLFVLVPNDG